MERGIGNCSEVNRNDTRKEINNVEEEDEMMAALERMKAWQRWNQSYVLNNVFAHFNGIIWM